MANDYAAYKKKLEEKQRQQANKGTQTSTEKKATAAIPNEEKSDYQKYIEARKRLSANGTQSSRNSDGYTPRGKLSEEERQPIYVREDGSVLRGSDNYSYVASRNATQNKTQESDLRDATWKDLLVNSAKRGYYSSVYGKESFDEMMGWENEKEKYKRILEDDDYQFEADKWWQQMISNPAQQLGQWYHQFTDPAAVAAGTAAAAGAFALGQAGPQVAIPEEVISVPYAFRKGMQAGGAKTIAEIEAGHAYNEMIEMGIDPEIAKNVAMGVGGANAALELLQVDELLDAYKMLDKTGATDSLSKRILRELAKRGVDIAVEDAQEVAQEGVTMGGTQLASKLDNGEGVYTWDDAKSRLGDTAKSSLFTFAGLNVPSTVMHTAQIVNENKQMSNIGKEYRGAENEAIEEGLSFDENTAAYKTAQEAKAAMDTNKALSDAALGRVIAANEEAVRQEERLARQNTAPQTASETVAEQAVETEQADPQSLKTNVPYNVMSNNNPQRMNAVRAREAALKKAGYGEHGTKELSAYADHNSISIEEAQSRFQTAYEAGRLNTPREKLSLETDVQQTAYNAGRMDYIADMAKAKDSKKFTAGKNSGFDTTNAPKDVTQTELRVTNDLLKALGSTGKFADDLLGNGEIYGDGSIRFSRTFERYIADDTAPNGKRKVSFLYHVAHEAGMHRVVQLAPEEGRAFINALYQNMSEGRQEQAGTLAQAKQAQYAEQNAHLTTEKAFEEIAANVIYDLYEDEDAFIAAVDRIVNGKDTKAKAGAKTFKEVLDDIVQKLKDIVNKLRGKEKIEAQEALTDVERLRDLWEKALTAAVQKNKELEAAQSLESNAQQEYNGANEIQHSLYWKPKLNNGEWSIVNSVMNGYHSNATWKRDDNTIGFHVKSKGEEVFGYYSTEDGTLLYAVGGKKAARAAMNEEEAYRRYVNNGTVETARGAGGRIKSLRSTSENNISNHRNAGNRETAVGAGRLSGTDSVTGQNSNTGTDSGRGKSNTKSNVSSNDGLVTNKNGEAVAQIHENGSAQFSLKTYKEGGRDYLTSWLDGRVKSKQLTKAEAKDIVQQLDDYYRICKRFEDKYAPFGAWSRAEVVTDSKGNPAFSVVKKNGEYAMNLDFSLVCKKRRTLDAVFSEMIKRGMIDDNTLAEEDIVKINDIIRDNGFETACALCFVDSKRYRQAKVAESFEQKYNEVVSLLLPEDGSLTAHRFNFMDLAHVKDEGVGVHTLSNKELKEGLDRVRKYMSEQKKGTVPYKIAKHILDNPKDRRLVSRAEFMNTKGFEAVTLKNPKIMKLYNSSKGSGGPKAAFSDVQYLGDILKKSNFTPAKAYAVGGVRIQSFSDYVPRLVFDYLQMIGDLAAKKLPAHAYTKEAMFAMQFGMTGIKINLSLVPAVDPNGVAAGLDSKGNYLWKDGQSFGSDVQVKGSGQTGFDLAVKLQNAKGYSANCGTIAVGVSDQHIFKMLDDPDIRMIIPYHKSSLNHIVAVMNNIDQYKDYTGVQNTRYAGGTKIGGKLEFSYNEKLRELGDAKAAAAEYVAWCKKNNYIPKFDDPANGVIFSEHPNYYKMLEDFSTYDNGKPTPQGAVTMTFPKEGDAFGSMAQLIEQGLEEDALLEGRRDKDVPKIVDQIGEVMGKSDTKQYSLKSDSEGNKLTEAQAEFFKDSKVRDEDGNLLVMRHGTSQHGFTVFDPKYSDDGISLFFTDSRSVAESYSGSLFDKSAVKDVDFNPLEASGQELVDFISKHSRTNYEYSSAESEIKVVINKLRDSIETFKMYLTTYPKFKEMMGEPYTDIEANAYEQLASLYAKVVDVSNAEEAHKLHNEISRWNSRYGGKKADLFDIFDKMQIYESGPVHVKRGLWDLVRMWEGADEHGKVFMGKSSGHRYMVDRAVLEELAEEIVDSVGANYPVYLNAVNPLIVEANGSNWDEIFVPKKMRNAPEFDGNAAARTRDFAAYAKNNGYDSVIFRDVVDVGPEAYDYEESTVVAVFNSNQVKDIYNENPTSDPDIRYSLKGQSDLMRQNAKLREVNQDLREQFKRTTFARIDRKKLDKFTKQLLKDYYSSADISETRDALDDLFVYIAGGDYGETPSWVEAQRMAYNVAMSVLEGASIVEDETYRQYSELRKELRTTGISISEEYAYDLDGYESVKQFRKANFGRIKITKNGTPVDKFYQQLAEQYPEFFDADKYTTQPEQLMHIEEVLDKMKPVEYNPFDYNMREKATWLANDIINRIFELQPKPTFADRAAQKLSDQKERDKQKLDKVRADKDAKLADQKSKSREKLDALRTEKNERIASLIAENREKINEVTLKEREKRDKAIAEIKSHYTEKQKEASKNRKARELRDKIERHAGALSKKLLTPSDKHHIPDEYRGLVLAVLESINLESGFDYVYDEDGKRVRKEAGTVLGAFETKRTQAFTALKERYVQLAEEGDIIVDPDLIGDAEYGPSKLDKIIAMGDTPIANLNAEQLQVIWDVIRSLEHGISKAGEMLSEAKFNSTIQWADAIRNDTSSRKVKKGSNVERFRIDLENPFTFFSHYGEAGKAIFRMLRDAQDRQQEMVSEIKDEVQKIVDRKSVEKWEREIHTFTTERGENLTLSTAHIMEIYLLMKRKDAEEHLLKGGIVQPEIEGILGERKKINRGTDAILLTFDDYVNILKTLKSEHIKVADGLQRLTSTTLADYGNEASMKAYGYKKFTGKDYWTIKSAKEGIHSNVEKGGNNTRSIKNIGLAKSVVPHANNALDIGGVFKTFSAHAGDMIDYAAWLCPMEDVNRLFNFKFKDTGKTMKGLLDRYGGKGAQQYWSRLMEDIQNGLSATNDSEFLAPINKVIGNVKGASVGSNIRVIVQQPTAFLRAAAVLNPANMTKGLAKGVTEGSGWQKALKYAAIAKRKDMGGFDISSPMQMNEIMFDSKGKLQRFNEFMMKGAAKADSITWGRIWNACEWEVAETTNLKAGSEEFYEAVAEKFTDVVDQSQVVDGVLQRSQTMRSGNAIMKQATAFMGEPTMSMNMLLRAYDAFMNETDGKARSAARKHLGRTMAALAVTTVVNALAQSLVDAWRDDDEDKKYWERFMAAFTGWNDDEEMSAWDKAMGVVLEGNLGSGLNPASYVPLVKDFMSLLQGYDVARADADVMSDIVSAFQTFFDSVSGDGKKTIAYATKNLVTQISKAGGISAPNILRDVWGIMRSIAVETDNVAVQYEMEKAIYKISNSGNNSRYMNILWRAYEQGDMETYEHIVKDMIANGIEATTIQSGMRSRAKKAGMVVDDIFDRGFNYKAGLKPTYEIEKEDDDFTIDNLSASQYISYGNSYNKLMSDIVDDFQHHGIHKMDEETANALLNAAYSYAQETALAKNSGGKYEVTKDWMLEAMEAEKNGVDIGTYIYFDKGTADMSKYEKLEFMDDMNLDQATYNALLGAAFFTETEEKKISKYLSESKYDDYAKGYATVYDKVTDRSDWSDLDESAQERIYGYADRFAMEYALEQVSGGEYNSTSKFGNNGNVDSVLYAYGKGFSFDEIMEALHWSYEYDAKNSAGESVSGLKKKRFIAHMRNKGYRDAEINVLLKACGWKDGI